MIDKKTLLTIPKEPARSVEFVCKKFREFNSSIPHSKKASVFSQYLEWLSLLKVVVSRAGGKFDLKMTKDREENIDIIVSYVNDVVNENSLKLFDEVVSGGSEKYEALFSDGFAYKFENSDLERIQEIINELRGWIGKTEDLEEEHRHRLLKRLEKLQSELHKKKSDVDRFWGLIGDAGVVFGKLGKDSKPFVDRIRELAGIVWKAQAESEQVPSDAFPPLLEMKDKA